MRHPQDLPCDGRTVTLILKVRRFRCPNTRCSRRTFSEQFPDWLPAHARCTTRLSTLVRQVGLEVGGESACRILHYFQVKVSGDTVLRRIRQSDAHRVTNPRVIGVDDWAFKKGSTYGTIIVDLEAQRVIDLLPDRTAQTLKAWLIAQPGIEFVARDRSSEYASAIQDACPDAVQVTDRWHLLTNLRQLAERYLSTIYSQLEPLSVAPDQAHLFAHHRPAFRRTQADKIRSTASRKQQEAIYHRVQVLRQQGYSIRKIAQLLAMHRATVTKYHQAESFPARKQNRQSRSILEPFLPYLRKRQIEGCENAMQLWREIAQQGYPGSHRQVQRWLQQHRIRPASNTPKRYLRDQHDKEPFRSKLPALRELSWLLVKDHSNLSKREQIVLEHLLQHPNVSQAYALIQQFGRMVRNRQVEQFQTWLDEMMHSPIPLFVNFAKALEQDHAAIEAALTHPWSNGQTEGQVNRLKFIKRQMYGRARFDLLRLRVLYSASST